MQENYNNNLSSSDIDAKLQRDVLENEDKVENGIIIIIVAIIIIFHGSIFYWLKFGIAIPSGYDYHPIPITSEPIQIDYANSTKAEKTFMYKSLINNNKMQMAPQAHYELSGRVVAFNHDFLFISKFFDSAALYDLGLSWGRLSDPKYFKQKYIKIYSMKTELTGARRLSWTWREDTPFTRDYIMSHISHTHVIPANNNIMAAMLKLKNYDKVKIEGELVDMNYLNTFGGDLIEYHTSLSRTDNDDSSRGSGACEAVYVTKVQIGNLIYK